MGAIEVFIAENPIDGKILTRLALSCIESTGRERRGMGTQQSAAGLRLGPGTAVMVLVDSLDPAQQRRILGQGQGWRLV